MSDPYYDKVVLLMHMDDTGLTDVQGSTVTLVGNATRSATQSAFGGYSCYLDGTGDNLSVPASTSLNLTVDDFTVELFFYCTSVPSTLKYLIDKDGVSAASYPQYTISVNASGKLAGFLGNGNGTSPTGTTYTGTTTVTANAWNHAALVRSGQTAYLFLNGTLEATGAVPGMYEGNKALLIGYQTGQPGTSYWTGYIDEVRITKGVARYTANFVPPASAFSETQTTISGTVEDGVGGYSARLVTTHQRQTLALDGRTNSNGTTGAFSLPARGNPGSAYIVVCHPYTLVDLAYDKVSLLMHGEDTALRDETGKRPKLFGNVARSAAQSMFGGYSIYFDGSGDYITFQHSAAFQFSGQDFTVECFVRADSLPAEAVLISKWNASGTAGSNQWMLSLVSGVPTFVVSTGGTTASATATGGSITTGVWTHIAAVRKGFLLTVYVAGTGGTPVACTGILYSSETEVLGISYRRNNGSTQYPFTGYMDEIRITKGLARYTADFSVPSSAFDYGPPSSVTENALIFDNVVPT